MRNYDEFVDWIEKNGLPDEVSFDHDLSTIDYDLSTWTQKIEYTEKTGYDAAKWLCEYCLENGLPIPSWNVHSANPVGRDNIISVLKGFEKRLNY